MTELFINIMTMDTWLWFWIGQQVLIAIGKLSDIASVGCDFTKIVDVWNMWDLVGYSLFYLCWIWIVQYMTWLDFFKEVFEPSFQQILTFLKYGFSNPSIPLKKKFKCFKSQTSFYISDMVLLGIWPWDLLIDRDPSNTWDGSFILVGYANSPMEKI